MSQLVAEAIDQESPPARVACIETIMDYASEIKSRVATREGGVDRNFDRLAILS